MIAESQVNVCACACYRHCCRYLARTLRFLWSCKLPPCRVSSLRCFTRIVRLCHKPSLLGFKVHADVPGSLLAIGNPQGLLCRCHEVEHKTALHSRCPNCGMTFAFTPFLRLGLAPCLVPGAFRVRRFSSMLESKPQALHVGLAWSS